MPAAFAFITLALAGVGEAIGIPASIAVSLAVGIEVAAGVGILVGLNALLTTKIPSPTPEALRSTTRQAIPPRRRGCGTVRLGGPFLLDYAHGSILYRVIAFADVPITDVLAYYLSQDQVTVVSNLVQPLANGAYPGNRVGLWTAFGVTATEPFPTLTSEIPTVWLSTSYGTGIFMGYMKCVNGKLQDYPTQFPRGKPQFNIVGRVGPVFDWRDVGQDRTDDTTWLVSDNPIVNLVHELWRYRGYDWDTAFAPTLSILTDEANICDSQIGLLNVLAKVVVVAPVGATLLHLQNADGLVPGMDLFIGGQTFTVTTVFVDTGGLSWTIEWSGTGLAASLDIGSVARWQADVGHPITENLYRSWGAWNADEAEADTVQRFMDAMDGWMMRRGSDGAVVIRCGHYYEPTVIFGADEVISYTWQPFVENSKAVNEVIPAFVSPAYDYSQIDTTPWTDAADVAARGLVSSQPFQPDMVCWNGQVRRLAKRKVANLLAHVESFTFKASGLRALGERYIRVQLPGEVDELEDIVLQVVGPPVIGDSGMSVTFPVAPIDPGIDTWDPYTEEGNGPSDSSSVVQTALEAATITSATPFDEPTGTGVDGIRIEIDADPPAIFSSRDDLTWLAQWRVLGATSWNTSTYPGLDPGSVVLDTSFVTADVSIELQVAYQTGGGQLSPWSATTTVSTSTTAIAPAQTTSLGVTSPGAGDATVTWRNPGSINFDHARVFRGTTSTFGSASDVSGALPGSPGSLASHADTGLSTGTYFYWVVAENASDTPSGPEGSQTVAVA